MNNPREKYAKSAAKAINDKFLQTLREGLKDHPELSKLSDQALLDLVALVMEGQPGFSVMPFDKPIFFEDK